jgi:hypothetical protein
MHGNDKKLKNVESKRIEKRQRLPATPGSENDVGASRAVEL